MPRIPRGVRKETQRKREQRLREGDRDEGLGEMPVDGISKRYKKINSEKGLDLKGVKTERDLFLEHRLLGFLGCARPYTEC